MHCVTLCKSSNIHLSLFSVDRVDGSLLKAMSCICAVCAKDPLEHAQPVLPSWSVGCVGVKVLEGLQNEINPLEAIARRHESPSPQASRPDPVRHVTPPPTQPRKAARRLTRTPASRRRMRDARLIPVKHLCCSMHSATH